MAKIQTNMYKILLLGDVSTGKTSILNRFIDNKYTDNTVGTTGMGFKVRTIDLDGRIIRLQIWDSTGNDRIQDIRTSNYDNAVGFMVIYDITDFKSFHNIEYWIESINQYATPGTVKMLIGNKCDSSKRKVETDRAQFLAGEYGMSFMEVSAKSSKGITEAFIKMAHNIKDIHDGKKNYFY